MSDDLYWDVESQSFQQERDKRLRADMMKIQQRIDGIEAERDQARKEAEELRRKLDAARDVIEAVDNGNLASAEKMARAWLDAEKPAQPKPELYRIVWWQSLIQGAVDGQTMDEDVPQDELAAKLLQYRIDFKNAIGMQIGAFPMSFVPRGDTQEAGKEDSGDE